MRRFASRRFVFHLPAASRTMSYREEEPVGVFCTMMVDLPEAMFAVATPQRRGASDTVRWRRGLSKGTASVCGILDHRRIAIRGRDLGTVGEISPGKEAFRTVRRRSTNFAASF